MAAVFSVAGRSRRVLFVIFPIFRGLSALFSDTCVVSSVLEISAFVPRLYEYPVNAVIFQKKRRSSGNTAEVQIRAACGLPWNRPETVLPDPGCCMRVPFHVSSQPRRKKVSPAFGIQNWFCAQASGHGSYQRRNTIETVPNQSPPPGTAPSSRECRNGE